MDEIESLTSRVDKLEGDIKPLLTLPVQLEMLIDAVKETNVNIKELSKHMEANYVSKDVMTLMITNETSTLKLWSVSAFFLGLSGAITGLYYVTHLGGR